MTAQLPPNLLALFTARPSLKYILPRDSAPEERRTTPIDGIGAYVELLREETANGEYNPTESWLEKRDRRRLEKEEGQAKLMTDGYKEQYKPHEDSKIRGTGFETLFVSRLSYKTTKEDLMHHFSRFGRIARIRVVAGTGENDKKHAGISRGYAFVQFENEGDMKNAYKASGDLVLNGRKVIVDVERGRTVANWRPRRFGGGLGGRHYTRAPKPSYDRFAGPPSGPGSFRGGSFRGGSFRGGGFRGDRGGGRFGDRGYDRGNGYRGGAPDGAPAGPRSGFGGADREYGGRGGGPNANYEPVQPRGGGYRDREQGYGRHDGGGGYDDRRPRY